MRRDCAVTIAAVCFGASLAAAQAADSPKLERRGDAPPAPAHTIRSVEPSTLPPAAQGEYLLDEAGSVVQITIDDYRVTGYVSKLGDEESDKDVPLTFFFERGEAQGDGITFTTRKVHGVWYSFQGKIVRGDYRISRDQNGYFRMEGTWTTHNDARATPSTETEKVSFKSTPRPLG